MQLCIGQTSIDRCSCVLVKPQLIDAVVYWSNLAFGVAIHSASHVVLDGGAKWLLEGRNIHKFVHAFVY